MANNIKKITLDNYVAGRTTFDVPLNDIFNIPENETFDEISCIYISNNGIASCEKAGEGTNTKFIFKPTSNVKETNHKYDITVKFTLKTTLRANETVEAKVRDCFIKLILTPEINDTTSSLHIINYMGKLSPDEYIKEHRDKDDLDSLVTKKALITNLKEFGKQVQNKVSNVQVFAIRYDLDGGSWNNGNEGRTSFVNSIAYVAPQPVKLGYTFNGWKIYKIADDLHSQQLNENISVDSMIPVGTNYDTLCVANWIRNNYEVTCYNANNEPIFSPSIEYNKNTTLLEASVDDTNIILPTKAGHTLDYWTTTDKFGQIITCGSNQNLNNVYDQIFEASNENIDRHIYLKPHFEPNIYKLNYNLKGGNLDGSDDTINTYKYGTTFTLPIPRRDGYKFNGWTIGSLVHQFIINPEDFASINSPVSLIAEWEKADFHLDYDLQGGTIANNDKFILKASEPISLGQPFKAGYNFEGWSLNQATDGTISGNIFTPADTIDHDITLKAIWSESDTTSFELQTWEETPESTGIFTDANNDTCSYRLIKSETAYGKTGNETNFSNTLYPKDYQIPEGFSLSKIKNAIIKGDGSSIVRIYIHRNIYNVKVVDKYESTKNSSNSNITYNTLYRTSLNEIGSATESTISCKFGQTITVYPLFNNEYPTNGYSCNSSGKTVIISGNDTIELSYRKKLIKITFDLNNAGSWTVGGQNIFEPNIYAVDIPYNSYLGASKVPSITNHASIKTSNWQIESANANDIISDESIDTHLFTCDTRIRRTYTYKLPIIHIESENYDEDNFGISNVLRSQYYDANNKLTTIPVDLLNPDFDAYRFIGYKYKFGENSAYSLDYITSITRDLWSNETNSNDLYLKAIFKRNEPSLDLNNINITYTDNTLRVALLANNLKDGATGFYLSTTNPNANVSSNLGTKDTNLIAEVSGSFQVDNNHQTVIIIPEKTFGDNQILGKPYIGTITNIDSNTNKVSINWIQSYQVYDNQDDATLTNVEFASNGAELSNKDLTLNISANADKVAIANGDISIIEKNGNTFTYAIDNFDDREHTIQITPIIYNKSGKSAFITYKQSIIENISNVLSGTNNIIELQNNKGTFYIKNNTNLTSGAATISGKELAGRTAYNDIITLSNNNAYVNSLILGKPVNSLKNYYIDTITLTLPDSNSQITVNDNEIYRVSNNQDNIIEFRVNSDLAFIPITDNISIRKRIIDDMGIETWTAVVYYIPSISGNSLILTNISNTTDTITLSLSNTSQVTSITCTLSQVATVGYNSTTITKYCITKFSESNSTEDKSVFISNVAYNSSGAKVSLTLNYIANNYNYSLISTTNSLSSYSTIKSAVDYQLNAVIDQSSNKQSGKYIDSNSQFTMSNIANASSIIIPNSLNVSLRSGGSITTYFDTTVSYNYSNIQEIIRTYKSKIINKIL